MKALVFEKPHQAVVKQVPEPEPKAGEVVIKVSQVGICGTDIHIYEGEFISPYPIIPGHEFSGVIHELGDGVEGFQIGDRVTADPSIFCGACPFCLTHRGNHCENWKAIGNTENGSMAELVAVPAKNVVKIPDSMSFAEAAFIEPMACVVHGMNRLDMKVGSRAILFGAGAMGQQLVQALSHAGASELCVVDISGEKLELALKHGATKGILSQNLEKDLSHPDYRRGFDIVVDATGIPKVIEQAFQYMGPAAKYLQFGVTPPEAEVKINPFKVYNKDWTILGSMAINHTFLPAFHWIREGRIQVDAVISKVISLEESLDFFAGARDPNLLKVQIKI